MQFDALQTAARPIVTAASIPEFPLLLSGDFLEYAVVFFVIAILAAVLGARGIAGLSMAIAKWFVIIFLVLAVITILL